MFHPIKQAATCKNVNSYSLDTLPVQLHAPQAGDVGVFRVVQANSAYIIDCEGVHCTLFEGDYVMLTYGNRYATNQVEGYVPDGPSSACQLLGRGGVAGIIKSKNATFRAVPAQLELVAYAVDANGKVINTMLTNSLERFNPSKINSRVILSVGSSMDSGKTTTAAWLCGGLQKAGFTVAYIKLTGTTFPKDAQLARARGAHYAGDFSQFGFPSTYLLERETLLNLYQSLMNRCTEAVDPDYVVIEIADGLLQRETHMLLSDKAFMSTVHSIILSCGDSLGALAGVDLLDKMAFRPFAVGGLFTTSDLLIEEVQAHCPAPVLKLDELINGKAVQLLLRMEEALVA